MNSIFGTILLQADAAGDYSSGVIGQFFGSMYSGLFEKMYGLDLSDYLWGILSPSGSNLYIPIGLTMIAVSLLFTLTYYYFIDKPRWSNWLGWLAFMAINAVINFVVGWQWVLSEYLAGKMDNLPGDPEPVIYEIDTVYFGLANMILSILWFFLFSMIVKWWSNNSSHSPF